MLGRAAELSGRRGHDKPRRVGHRFTVLPCHIYDSVAHEVGLTLHPLHEAAQRGAAIRDAVVFSADLIGRPWSVWTFHHLQS